MDKHAKKKGRDSPYVGISIPRTLAESVETFLEEAGYVSLSDLTRDLLREWLRGVANYKLAKSAEATK